MDLGVYSAGSSSISLRWYPPARINGRLRRYEVGEEECMKDFIDVTNYLLIGGDHITRRFRNHKGKMVLLQNSAV